MFSSMRRRAVLLGVDGVEMVTHSPDAAANLAAEGITWRSFFDGSTSGPIATAWNVSGWPTIYVLDAGGVIRFKDVRGEALDDAIDELLEELEDADGDADSGADEDRR